MAEKTVELAVEGISCQHCVASVQKALDKLDGAGRVQVELEGKKVEIVCDPDLVDLQTIRVAIEVTTIHTINRRLIIRFFISSHSSLCYYCSF